MDGRHTEPLRSETITISSSIFAKNSAHFFRALTIFVIVLSSLNTCYGDEVKTKTPYYGKHIGDFPEQGLRDHYLAGKVYAIDHHRIFIYKQNYDGKAPMAYYWIGNSSKPDRQGQPIRWPSHGSAYFSTVKNTKPLPRAFAYENVLVEMPAWANISSYTWFSMWCDQVHRSFGHVKIPPNFSPPKPRSLSSTLKETSGLNGLSSGPVTLLDSKTILLEKLSLNGAGVGAGFYVGKGTIEQGTKADLSSSAIRVPDEYGSTERELRSYVDENVILTLPLDVTFMDVEWLSVYSNATGGHLAFLSIPRDMEGNIPPNMNAMAIGYAGSGGLKGSGILSALIWTGIVSFIRNFWIKSL